MKEYAILSSKGKHSSLKYRRQALSIDKRQEGTYLPEATNDTAFLLLADTSPKALLQLGLVVLALAALIAAIVVHRRRMKD